MKPEPVARLAMSERLPNHLNMDRLRRQAKELKRAVNAGEKNAIDRVLAIYPPSAGTPRQPFEHEQFALRTAQHVVARELGFTSWAALVEAAEAATPSTRPPRWQQLEGNTTAMRAMGKAWKLGHASVALPHFLLALLDPPTPGPAYQALTELGVSYDDVLRMIEGWDLKQATAGGTGSTPVYHLIDGWTRGLAVATGATTVTDEHTLLALTYGITGTEFTEIEHLGLDPDEVYETLRQKRVMVPKVRPPIGPTPSGPWGPYVYYPRSEHKAVIRAVMKRYPIGSPKWGFNVSKWKPGYFHIDGEDHIPMEQIVKSAVTDRTLVEVVPIIDAHANERQARRQTGN